MENSQIMSILNEPETEMSDNSEDIEDLNDYQVTRAELFSHSREPAITIWSNRIKFNMPCLRRFPGVTHIQLLIHPEQKRLIIRPCQPDTPDSLRWARGSEKELTNRDLLCRIFAAKVFDLMNWNSQYRYKILGKPAVYKNEILFLFKLTDFELFLGNSKKQTSYLPGEWRDYFGTPVAEHEDSYRIDLAEGYITTKNV